MIYITGDIHGSLLPLCELSNKHSLTDKDIVIILGDVGVNYYGGKKDKQLKYQMNNMGCTFFCVHGNHENRPQNIASYKEKEWHGGCVLYEEAYPNILFPIDGDIFELEGKKYICIGGAYSVDKYYRLNSGYKWWEDEQPSDDVKRYVEKQLAEHKVDIILSHTCPYKYVPTECFIDGIDQSTVDNSTEQWLDAIECKTDYESWYCGHWHTNKRIDKIHFLYHDVEIVK